MGEKLATASPNASLARLTDAGHQVDLAKISERIWQAWVTSLPED